MHRPVTQQRAAQRLTEAQRLIQFLGAQGASIVSISLAAQINTSSLYRCIRGIEHPTESTVAALRNLARNLDLLVITDSKPAPPPARHAADLDRAIRVGRSRALLRTLIARGDTLGEIAAARSVNRSTVANWLTGRRSPGQNDVDGLVELVTEGLPTHHRNLTKHDSQARAIRSVRAGALIRTLTTDKGLTVREIAAALHVTHCAVVHWSTGRRVPRSPQLDSLILLVETTPSRKVSSGTEKLFATVKLYGFRQVDIARTLGVSQQLVSQWRMGVRPLPDARRRQITALIATRVPTPIPPSLPGGIVSDLFEALARAGHITDEQIAASVGGGITAKVVEQWRTGEIPPRTDTIERLARLAGLRVALVAAA